MSNTLNKNKPLTNGLTPVSETPPDNSLDKAKEAAPFVPQSIKTSFTSQAHPFTPSVSSPYVPLSPVSSGYISGNQLMHSNTLPYSSELTSEASVGYTMSSPSCPTYNNTPYLIKAPQRQTFQTVFVPPQLVQQCENDFRLMMSQEAPNDPRYKQIPQRYHCMKVLDSSTSEMVTGSFGYLTSVYKVVDSTDGCCYALRRVERVRTNNEMVSMVVERWNKLNHPSIIRLHDCYLSNGAVFFVHDYIPSAISLYDRYLNLSTPVSPLNEDILWCIVIQLLLALQAIHNFGLCCRVIDCKHVLETERNRYRIGSVGVMDVLEPRNNQHELQMKDCCQLGYLMLLLSCRGSKAIEVATMSIRYSEHYVHIIQSLLQGQYTVNTILEQCTPQLIKTLNTSFLTVDTYYTYLSQEYTNGRYMRLLMKLAFINDRPDEKGYAWSDTGDRYIIRLFRDFVFHQKDGENRPILDCGHIYDALAKLDIGDEETIPLCSPDGKTVLVCSYADVKRCLDNAYMELVNQSQNNYGMYTPYMNGFQGGVNGMPWR